MRCLLVVTFLGPIVGACGGDDGGIDLTGIYRVEAAIGSAPCGTDVPDPDAPPFLRFTKEEILGAPYFAYEGCMDEAGTDCGGGAGVFGGVFEPIDGGWRGVVTSSSGTGGTCALGYFEQTALLDGTMLVIESNRHGETVALPEAQCRPEEAEKRGDAMPCEEHVRIDATRLTTM